MLNVFITANKFCRYGPIIAHNHVNLKPNTARTPDHDSLFMELSQITHPGPTTCDFQLLDVAVNGSAHGLAVIFKCLHNKKHAKYLKNKRVSYLK